MSDWSHRDPAGQSARGTGCPTGGACHHSPDCADVHCPGRPDRGAHQFHTHSAMSKPNWFGGIAAAALFFTVIHLAQQLDEPEQEPDQPAERTEAMKATGLVFMSRSTPSLTRDASGEPQLLLRTVHRAGKYHTEAWTLVWRGQAAADFHARHAAELTAGQPLQVTATNLRTHQVGHLAEIQAHIESCSLAPRAQALASPANA